MEFLGEHESVTYEELQEIEHIEKSLKWPFLKILAPLLVLVSIYLLLIYKILPFYVKNRAPLQLTKIMVFYNIVQVGLSAYTFLIYLHYIYNYGIITSRCPRGVDLREVANKIYPYFIAKHLDLLDTVFFVLRKKFKQVSFLHVYHHITMIVWAWLYYLYHPCDNFVVVGLLNSFVHMVMYTYYGIAALGPAYSKYVWWKKHLTKIQLMQFVLVLLNMYYQQKDSPCPTPSFFYNYGMFAIISFFILFMNFYVKSYSTGVRRASSDS